MRKAVRRDRMSKVTVAERAGVSRGRISDRIR